MMESVTKQQEQEQEKVIVDELAGLVQIHSDGSIRRTGKEPTLGMSQLEASQMGVKTRDMLVVMPWQQEQGQGQELLERGRGGHGHRVWVRLYVPEDEDADADADAERELLPVVLYFHGGGFCMLSPASVIPHNMCVRWCSALRVLIVSVSYRLAPEHRLPAAYHDGAVAATWLLSGAGGDPWMRSHADLRNVFLLGDTAGCNIAHHVMLLLHRHGHAQGQAQAQAVRGVIMLQPFLGSQARTPSEIQDEEEQQQQRRSSSKSKSKSKSKRKRRVYDVRVSDTLWRMALPLGSDRDHPYCFPTAHGGDGALALALPLPLPLPRTLVVMGGTEVGSERQVEYCDALRRRGVYVEALLLASEDHAFCSLMPHSASSSLVLQRVRRFIASASASASPPSPFPVPRL